MIKELIISDRKIGYKYEPVVIAEIGINHNGSLEIAKKMVDAAERAGVEIVKHQTHIVNEEMSSEAKTIKPGNSDLSIFEIMKNAALTEGEEREFKEYVENKEMIFLSTPFSRAAVDRLVKMNVPAFKIGSGECNNYPLLEYIASFCKPIILSTGMNTIDSVSKAVKILKKHKNPFALLHTTNLYPTPNKLVRLGAMQEMANHFPGIPYGLSDHTTTNHACYGAAALGASILERHFTDRKDRKGPDIICSMDENECKELINGVKIIYDQRGGCKGPVKEEKVTINFAFASVCSIKNIKKGEIFTKDNIWVKRPGTGEISAENYEKLLGKRASKNIKNNKQLKWEHVK